MKSDIIRSKEEWENSLEYDANIVWQWEQTVSKYVMSQENKKIHLPGHCQICDKDVDFLLDDKASDGTEVNYRERMICPSCGLRVRQRAMLAAVKECIDLNSANVYMYEQITPSFKAMQMYCPNLSGSEYLGSEYESGYINENGILHEDATALSFDDESFDCLISQDVFEHVADIDKTLHEAYRILKWGRLSEN